MRLFKRISFLIIVIAIGIFVWKSDYNNQIISVINQTVDTVSDYIPFIHKSSSMSEREINLSYYYSFLNKEEQEVYCDILNGILEESEDIRVDFGDIDRCFEIYYYIINDHPELFWCGDISGQYYGTEEYVVLHPKYLVTGKKKREKQQKIENVAQEWLNQIPENISDYEKVKKVYEVIVNNVEYELDSPDSQNISSVFINNVSVCAGYAKATKYLLDQLDIKSIYVYGYANYNNGEHAWNIVEIDDGYYHVDSTWGDPNYNENNLDIKYKKISYTYLCMSDKEISKTHTISKDINYPKCQSEKYNYYKITGTYFDNFDLNAIKSKLLETIQSKKRNITLKFKTDTACNKFKDNITNGEYTNILYNLQYETNILFKYYYQYDDDNNIMILYFNYD